ncbi:unnamed protein product, partial [Coregonus sp. 'balchen']
MTQETTDAQPFPAAVHQPCADTFSTSEEEEEKTMEKNDGVLTEEEVSSCLSNLCHWTRACLSVPLCTYNCFSEIGGLLHCASLTHLSLAHNKISRISGLDNLPIKDLCLVLDLSLNRITSLSGLQNLHLLGSINLERDLISEIKEATHIHDLWLLRELNLQRNPVQEQLDYRLAVIFLLQHLTVLDQEKVTAEEKVSALNKYDPPLEVVAAREHMSHMVYQLMQPQHPTQSGLSLPHAAVDLAPGLWEEREFNDFFAYG